MKKIVLTLFIMLLSVYVYAQEQEKQQMSTLFGNEEIVLGGYGAPIVQYSASDHILLLTGGKGGVIINHQFVVGIAGYGTIPIKDYLDDNTYCLSGGYGGLYFEYINSYNKLIHFSANVVLGIGGMVVTHRYDDDFVSTLDWKRNILASDIVFVIEPQIEAELNVTSWMKVALGIGYKFVPDLTLSFYEPTKDGSYLLNETTIDEKAISGLTLGLSFKFGDF